MGEVPLAISLQDIANIVTFIVPGYLALMIYSIKYAKTDRNVWNVIIESIAWSLPLIAVNNYIWEQFLSKDPVNSLNKEYAIILFVLAIVSGFLAAWLREAKPINWVAGHLGVDSPQEDFIRSHFAKLKPNDAVSVRLKSGAAFSGTPSRGSIYSKNGPRKYCFEYIAWYNEEKKLGMRPMIR